jgi:hypothetical protein
MESPGDEPHVSAGEAFAPAGVFDEGEASAAEGISKLRLERGSSKRSCCPGSVMNSDSAV